VYEPALLLGDLMRNERGKWSHKVQRVRERETCELTLATGSA
jgi:hypothetical protein